MMMKSNAAKVLPLATAILTFAAIGTAEAASHTRHLRHGALSVESGTVGSETHTVGSHIETHTVESETHTVTAHIESETVESETHTVNAHVESETVESESHTVIAPATHPVIVRAPEINNHSNHSGNNNSGSGHSESHSGHGH
jgi:hypothetical protein